MKKICVIIFLTALCSSLFWSSSLAQEKIQKSHVNPSLCVGCGDCNRICPVAEKAITIYRGKAVVDPDLCIACKRCKWICSYGAVW